MKAAVTVEVCTIPLVHLPKRDKLRLGHNVTHTRWVVPEEAAHALSIIAIALTFVALVLAALTLAALTNVAFMHTRFTLMLFFLVVGAVLLCVKRTTMHAE